MLANLVRIAQNLSNSQKCREITCGFHPMANWEPACRPGIIRIGCLTSKLGGIHENCSRQVDLDSHDEMQLASC